MTLLRSLVFITWLYGGTLVAGVLMMPFLLFGRKALTVSMRAYVRVLFWGFRVFCDLHWEIRNIEKLPPGAGVVALKHQSMFDTLVIWLVVDDPVLVFKKSLILVPIFGWYAMALGNIPVDRSAGSKALRGMIKTARKRIAQGRRMVIFPEGTRVKPGARASYKPGVAALYKELSAPCTPIALNSGLCWPRTGLYRYPGTITLEVLDPIPAGLARKTFMRELEEKLESASDRLLAEARGGKP